MRALFRYVFLKSTRERFLAPIVCAPAMLIGICILVMMIPLLAAHRTAYPFTLSGLSPDEAMRGLAMGASMLSAIAGGVAAFWIFRQDVADRSIAALVLATRPLLICLTAILYGTAAGTAAFLAAVPVIAFFTAAIPPHMGGLMAVTVGSTIVAAAAALVLESISPDYGMLLPMALIAIVTVAGTFDRHIIATTFAAAAALILPLIASALLERRCAA